MIRFIKAIFIFFLFLNIVSSNYTYSQVFSKLGVKFGFALSGMSTFNNKPTETSHVINTFIQDSTSFFNHVSVDLGITAELFNSEWFCLSTELHYLQLGEAEVDYYTSYSKIQPNGYRTVSGRLFDRTHYLSLQLLPRVRVGIGRTFDNYYFFGGPVFDFKIADENEYTDSKYVDATKIADLGAAVGIGFEVIDLFTMEVKYQYNFTGPYKFRNENEEISRRYSALVLLASFTIFDRAKYYK
jgi:hypothetical protein